MSGLAALGVMAGTSGAFAQDDAERNAMAERLAPVGQLCLEGQDCGTASAAPAESSDTASSDGSLDGESLYNSLGCAACHASGVAGAPVYGDAEAWAPRIEQGNEALYESVFNGKGAMPPRGGSGGSDEEIMAAVDHMVAEAQ
ncbi:cytochrome c5 family protein [Halomonas alkaliantarctica]|nr:cytochrome c5 family protein [Halomonas alkaliantarctica]